MVILRPKSEPRQVCLAVEAFPSRDLLFKSLYLGCICCLEISSVTEVSQILIPHHNHWMFAESSIPQCGLHVHVSAGLCTWSKNDTGRYTLSSCCTAWPYILHVMHGHTVHGIQYKTRNGHRKLGSISTHQLLVSHTHKYLS